MKSHLMKATDPNSFFSKNQYDFRILSIFSTAVDNFKTQNISAYFFAKPCLFVKHLNRIPNMTSRNNDRNIRNIIKFLQHLLDIFMLCPTSEKYSPVSNGRFLMGFFVKLFRYAYSIFSLADPLR